MSLDFYASASLQHPVVLMVSFYEFENWISSLKNRLQYIFERERDSVFWNFLIYRTTAKKNQAGTLLLCKPRDCNFFEL